MEVEIDAAERTIGLGLAQNYGDLLVQRDAVTEIGTPAQISLDRFFHQRIQGRFTFLGGFVQADDKFVVRLHRLRDFLFEHIHSHKRSLSKIQEGRKTKILTTGLQDYKTPGRVTKFPLPPCSLLVLKS